VTVSRTRTCSRSWEVEAARDGRLDGAARAQLERHAASCPSCARETRALESLGERLRALGGAPADDVSLQRLKRRVTQAIDRDRFGPAWPAAWPVWAFASFAGGAACIAVLAFVFARRADRAVDLTDPVVEVTAGSSAQWAMRTDRDVKRVDLASGSIHIRIARRPGDRVVVVELPDGEIDDTGTVFSVTVAAQRTRRVEVDEGSVLLRLRDQPEHRLVAGEIWERATEDDATPPGQAVGSGPAPEVRALAPSTTPAPRPPAQPRRNVSALPGVAPSIASSRPPPSPPDAASDEDRAYLGVLRLLRAGDTPGAKAAAAAYLSAFPDGFRAPELRKLLAEPPSPARAGAAP
jgi:anti-sigma factor RsiW